MIIDFHSHTFFSDGSLSLAEHIRRAQVAGYKAIGITDHVDQSNIEEVFLSVRKFTDNISKSGWDIIAIPGVELTHVPKKQIGELIKFGRDLGIKLIIVHGETPVEPVEEGTNYEAIMAGCDILAHPGFISEDEVKLASEKGVYLELTAKKGHCLTNGHILKLGLKYNAKFVISSDAHIHTDFLNDKLRRSVVLGAGGDEELYKEITNNMEILLDKIK